MKPRRIAFLLAFILLAYYFYSVNKADTVSPPASITKQQIFTDFSDLQDNQMPEDSSGGTFKTLAVYFPDDFLGDEGDEFYVTMDNGSELYTQRYIIYGEAPADKAVKLVYRLKVSWKNYRPPAGQYDSYNFDGDKWTEVKK